MSDTDYIRLKIITEKQLGRDLQPNEEHCLKGLLYFGRGVKLKAELDSGPVLIRVVLPGVMEQIARRRKIVLGKGCLQRFKRRRKLNQNGSQLEQLSEWPAARRQVQKLAFVEQK